MRISFDTICIHKDHNEANTVRKSNKITCNKPFRINSDTNMLRIWLNFQQIMIIWTNAPTDGHLMPGLMLARQFHVPACRMRSRLCHKRSRMWGNALCYLSRQICSVKSNLWTVQVCFRGHFEGDRVRKGKASNALPISVDLWEDSQRGVEPEKECVWTIGFKNNKESNRRFQQTRRRLLHNWRIL